MICLTGDLHHSSLCTGNQQHADTSEIRIAVDFLRRVEEAGVKTTFFISGRSFEEEADDLRPIIESPLVEIGGHNYSCLTPTWLHRVYKKTTGSYNGPRFIQRRDALRTMEIIRNHTGRTIRAWRNHMYMHGPNTEEVLSACGIDICSDGVRAASRGPEWHPAGIWNVPLNVIPDHEHIYHAERTPEWVDAWVERYGWSDDFGSASYPVEEWADLVLEQLRQHEQRGTVATMIIHPITMYLADGFRSFERILDYIAGRPTAFISEAVDAVRDGAMRGAA
jgi:hypothetical protein